MAESEPLFAIEVGVTALKWLIAGYGYEVTGDDVRSVYLYTMKAAEVVQLQSETFERVRTLVAEEVYPKKAVNRRFTPIHAENSKA